MKIQSLTASPDAFLMNLMRQIEIAEQRCDRALTLSSAMTPGDTLYDEMKSQADVACENLHYLVRQVCTIPARTDEGRAAKARLFQSFNSAIKDDGNIEDDADILVHIAHSLSLDLAGPPLLSSAL